jgi:hypothetical protein
MATELKSQQDYYDEYQTEVQSLAPQLTDFSEGSINDIEGGVLSSGMRELSNLFVDLFRKCFFGTADGPEVTGGDDDLQTLAVDQFGNEFARPASTKAVVTVTFTRPTFAAGGGTILADKIVKTQPDASGNSQRFRIVSPVTVGPTTLSVNASVEAVVAGTEGNVDPGTITVIESALFDSTFTVTNTLKAAGGAPTQDDPTYRDTIQNKIETLKGGTIPGIEAKAKTIAGVATATVIENEQVVIEYNIQTQTTTGNYFRIPRTILYIADVNGSASDALVTQVRTALQSLRAAGVKIDIAAATAKPMDWIASLVLNPSGPNFSVLENDASQIIDSMRQYINSLPIGTRFNRVNARKAILAIWGPLGTNDLTDFTNLDPVGDVQPASFEKLIADNVGVE